MDYEEICMRQKQYVAFNIPVGFWDIQRNLAGYEQQVKGSGGSRIGIKERQLPIFLVLCVTACFGYCAYSGYCACWDPSSILSTCVPDPSSFLWQTGTHSYLLKLPELPAWQCCQLSAVTTGGRHSPRALELRLPSAAHRGDCIPACADLRCGASSSTKLVAVTAACIAGTCPWAVGRQLRVG